MTTFQEVDGKGVRTNLKKMQTLLSVSLALSMAATSVAGERNRSSRSDSDAVRTSSSAEPVIFDRSNLEPEMIAPGVARLEVGGFFITASQNGAVLLADVIAQYGSLEEYKLNEVTAMIPAARAADGTLTLANGALYYIESAIGSSYPAPKKPTVESYQNHMAWSSSGDVTVFVNGAHFVGQAQARPVMNVPMMIGFDGNPVYANGATEFSR